MPARPVIAISTGRAHVDNGPIRSYPLTSVGEDYPRSVLASGGTPLLLALHDPDVYPGVVAHQLDCADGLLLSGGPDVNPLVYGEQPHPGLGPTIPERDRFDLALIAEARRRRLPVLAICRGVQILNVAYGGTLYQDLPRQHPGVVQHEQQSARHVLSHHVEVTAGSRLAGLLGEAGTLAVTSFHHQAIKAVGDGLAVVATAPDGLVEAVEATDHPWIVGVQWHPEMSHPGDEAASRLFAGFVTRCAVGR